MALTTSTLNASSYGVDGKVHTRTVEATIAAYTASGERLPLTFPNQLGLRRIVDVRFVDPLSTTGFVWRYDPTPINDPVGNFAPGSLVDPIEFPWGKIQCFEVPANAADAPLIEADASDNCGVVTIEVRGY